MLKKLTLLTVALIVIFFNDFIPIEIQSILYAISLSIKTLILFLLPFIIFGLLFNVIVQLANQATKIIIMILAAVCCSNFLSTMLSHSIGELIYQLDFAVMIPKSTIELTPTWTFTLPKLIGNDKAMLVALLVGGILSYAHLPWAKKTASYLSTGVNKTLSLLTYIIPWFILGSVIKLSYDGAMLMIVRDYSLIFLIILLSVFSYITLLYFVGNHFKFNKMLSSLQHMLPAGIAGFSTMSSAAAMPFTILGAESNACNKPLARSIIPTTVNIHLIGDCFAIPILAFAILKSFDMPAPLFSDYFIFALYFVIAKFSVAAVPGGGIIVMLPTLENYMGFNAPMLSLITALYVLFDPVITCANVLGNGAFALLMDKLQTTFAGVKQPS